LSDEIKDKAHAFDDEVTKNEEELARMEQSPRSISEEENDVSMVSSE
jgi:hypothetical protein